MLDYDINPETIGKDICTGKMILSPHNSAWCKTDFIFAIPFLNSSLDKRDN